MKDKLENALWNSIFPLKIGFNYHIDDSSDNIDNDIHYVSRYNIILQNANAQPFFNNLSIGQFTNIITKRLLSVPTTKRTNTINGVINIFILNVTHLKNIGMIITDMGIINNGAITERNIDLSTTVNNTEELSELLQNIKMYE